MDVPFDPAAFNANNYDLAGELKRSGLTAICMTFCVDRPNLNNEGDAYQRFITSLDEMDLLLKANDKTRALSFADIKKAHAAKKTIVIQ